MKLRIALLVVLSLSVFSVARPAQAGEAVSMPRKVHSAILAEGYGAFPLSLIPNAVQSDPLKRFDIREGISASEFLAPTVTVSPNSLPGGIALSGYSQTLGASGGTSPYTFAVTSGTLPTGLTLSSGGALTGRLKASGTFNFTATATDANKHTASQAYSITVTGAMLTVNSTSDVVATCSMVGTICLRNAMSAVTNMGTIAFSVSGTLTLGSMLPAVSSTVTIDGTGQSITINGNTAHQIVHVGSGGNLTLNALTLSNGNNTGGNGGAILNNGTLTVTNSTFSGNSANGNGGAIESDYGTFTVANSTFYNNSANPGVGGAIDNFGGQGIIINSTFANNSASGSGGGIFNSQGMATFTNTIMNNTSAAGDCGGSPKITDGGNNLEYPGVTCNFVSGAVITNPMLGPLQNNGGSSFTMALLPGSPAIGAGIATVCAAPPVWNKDERGIARQTDAIGSKTFGCDIGAYETPGVPTLSEYLSSPTIAANGTTTLIFTLFDPNLAVPLHNVSFAESLPTNLTVAANPGITNNCPTPGTVRANGGSSTISLIGAVLQANSACTITVNVTSSAAGTYPYLLIGPISSNETGSGANSSIIALNVSSTQQTGR
jgi:predicted outer membrane repeat protein